MALMLLLLGVCNAVADNRTAVYTAGLHGTATLRKMRADAFVTEFGAPCRYVPHKGTLTWEQAREFVGSIRTGARSAAKLHQDLPALGSIEAWDGQDGKVTAEDEFSLDDIMNS